MSWQAMLGAAQPVSEAFDAAIVAPHASQTALLMRCLSANRDTEFGRRHGFDRISGLEDFQRAVPVLTPDDYVPWVGRIAAGEPNVLTSAPVIAFERTSGTTAGGRLVPYTADSLLAFRSAVLPWLAGLARRRPGIARGRLYASISPATRPAAVTASGIPIGLPSDAAYLGDDLIMPFLALLAVSPQLGQIADVDSWRLATLTGLVAAADLSVISVWSPTFLVELVNAIPDHAEAIAAQLGPDARTRFTAALRGGSLDTARLWPMLDCISCWTDGASAGLARQLAVQFPAVALDPKGLLATEAAVTTPFGEQGRIVTAVLSSVVEYIDEAGQPHLCDTLEAGARYRVVLTTPGGLYRYAIGDIVTCTGIEGGIAALRFEGRDGVNSDMVGEKLDDAFVSSALAGLGQHCALCPAEDPARYELWVDADLDEPALAAIAQSAEQALRANPHYDYARKMRQLAAVTVFARPGFLLDLTRRKVAAGTRLGDVKPVGLLLRGNMP